MRRAYHSKLGDLLVILRLSVQGRSYQNHYQGDDWWWRERRGLLNARQNHFQISSKAAGDFVVPALAHNFQTENTTAARTPQTSTTTHLDRLPVLLEHIDPHHGLVELWIRALDQLVVQVLLVVHGVEALQHKLEQRVQVLGAGRSNEDVGVLEADSGGDGQTEGGRLTATSAGSQRDRGAEPLLADRLHELEQRLRLAADVALCGEMVR